MSLSRFPLVAALLIAVAAHAAEVAVSEPRFVPAPDGSLREISSIASGDGTDLVAWTERAHSFDFTPGPSTVYIRTYDAGGVPLQPAQIAIGFGFGALAVWNGTDYFVAYGRFFSRFGTFVPSPDIEAVRVTREGRIVEGSRISLMATRATGGSINALAWDGTHYFAIVNADFDSRLLLLDRDGHVLRSQGGFALSIAALPGGGFMMLRIGGGGAEWLRVGRDGELGPATPLGSAAYGSKLEVHGDRIAVVRHTEGSNVAEELDDNAQVLASVALPNDAAIHSLVWRESTWVAAYDRTTAGCTVRFESGITPSTTCSETARQSFAGIDRAAWTERGVEVRNSRDLSLSGGDLASVSATMQSDAAVAATPTGSLVAWFEGGAMHVGALARDGSRRGERTINAEAEPHHPALATAGGQTLLVYLDGMRFQAGAIRAVRLDADGNSLGPAFTLGHGLAPSVASDGREWLVVWQSSDASSVRPQVLAARVTANGDAASEVPVFANDASQSRPSVAWSGAGYVVAWTEGQRVMTQLVDRSGSRIANALTLVDDRVSGVNFNSVSVACGPGSCFAAWSSSWSAYGVYGAVLATDGTRRSENRLLLKSSALTNIAVAPAADGTFRLAHDNRYIFLDAAGAPLATVTWLSVPAEIAGIADGRIVYARVTAPEELLGGAIRLFTRDEPPPPRMRAAGR
ncbi:MAG TPA: hypothetical protein VGQ46_06470 [Thermoanaerobaculia bacterium]|jgi:hypothetical protein|nr:hypothetical protein [Thermoanaerobaculia bacterium]